ncbi:FKBP-type peptidyl-prolyl cis-trans isomerase [Thalassotalea aquiviva]|uniref:FKBP-type peptidyl-prolyl cis-trans isomerase n=1 Tax=Thalassotalea aquiviva TaxID=3242415 RepID=UPI00352B53ED
MKLILKPTLAAVAVLAVMGCQPKEEKAVVLETEAQKQAYGLGSSIGSYMNTNLEQQEKMGVALDKELLIAGFKESLMGKSQLEKAEIEELLKALDQQIQQKSAEAQKLESEKNLTEGQTYLAENAKVEGVVTTESGLQYQVITAAEGDKPKATDTVKVHYKGTLIDGTTFDSSYDRGEPIEFPLNRVIPGWTEGVQLMSVGSSYKFVIPSELAYGPTGSGPIPGNSTLIFEVELLDIVTPEETN